VTRPDRYANRSAAREPFCAALRAYHEGDADTALRLRSSLGEDERLPASVFFRAGDDDTGAWPPAGAYSGQAWIDLEFGGTRGRPFRELYLDLETLMTHAFDAGWRAEVAFEDGGAFLMRLRRP